VSSYRRARGADAGFTLVELGVAGAVGSLLLAAVATLFIGALRTVDGLSVRSVAVGDARIALESMSRTIRVAYRPPAADAALVSASPTGMSFWALLDRSGSPSDTMPAPTFVVYGYDGQCVTQTLIPSPSGSLGGTPPPVPPGSASCLLRTSIPPVFTYYPAGTGASPLVADPAMAGADLLRVGSVNVEVQVHDPAQGTIPPLPVTVQVTLENGAS
jgi:type II secretory pathway pseudopilin PulG